MLNPMLATVMLSGCAGFSWPRHVLVYWIGGLAGSVLGHLMCSTVKALDERIMLSLVNLRLKMYLVMVWPFATISDLIQPFILIIRILMTDLTNLFAQVARPFQILRGFIRYKPHQK